MNKAPAREKALVERMKELNCLYEISSLFSHHSLGLERLLREIVKVIPRAWQYPERTCVRISHDGQDYRSKNYAAGSTALVEKIRLNDRPCGFVEVAFLDGGSRASDAVFLEDEKRLLKAIAELLGNILEKKVAEVSLKRTTGGDEPHARQAVQQSDNERAAFHRFLFHARWDSADLYDLVINTHGISPKTAAALVVETLAAEDFAGKKREASRTLENLYLARKAIVAILFEQKLPIRSLDIECDGGAITLRGTARDRPSIERCEETAVRVCRAKRVTNEICFDPRYVELLGGIHSSTAERMTG